MSDYSIPTLQDLARSAANRWGVPESLFLWQIGQESSWNPNAYNANNGGTPAIGIAQFQPATAQQYGVNPYDPVSSLEGAAKYDAYLFDKYGTWDSALRHYGTIHNDATSAAAAKALAANPLEGGIAALNNAAKSLFSWTPFGMAADAGANIASATETYAQRISIAVLGIVLIGGGVLMFALSTDAGQATLRAGKSVAKKAAAAAVIA